MLLAREEEGLKRKAEEEEESGSEVEGGLGREEGEEERGSDRDEQISMVGGCFASDVMMGREQNFAFFASGRFLGGGRR